MARVRRPLPQWPAWRHGPNGESAIFACEADVPKGWTATSYEAFTPTEQAPIIDRDDIMDQVRAKGFNPLPTWSIAYMKGLLA